VDLYIHSPHTPSWRSASLVKHRDNFTFTLPSSRTGYENASNHEKMGIEIVTNLRVFIAPEYEKLVFEMSPVCLPATAPR
jgi:hypothetical protein